ncbi:MAG: hypothetical protein JWR23_727 [Mucilaginibacter sp.]|nr:hypothetical protein [Mucilaginibacter sp.]
MDYSTILITSSILDINCAFCFVEKSLVNISTASIILMPVNSFMASIAFSLSNFDMADKIIS